MRKMILGWLLVASIVLSAGCGPHSTQRAGARDEGVPADRLIDPLAARNIGYNTGWSADLMTDDEDSLTYISILDDLIVALEVPSGLVSATSLRDGSVKWQRIIPDKAANFKTPVRAGDIIYVATEYKLWAIAAPSGQVVGMQELENTAYNAPTIFGQTAIFGGASGRVFAHDLNVGLSNWTYRMPSGVKAMPLIVGGNVLVADTSGEIRMLNAATGEVVWANRTFIAVSAAPVASSSAVFIASWDRTLYCLNRATGSDRWKYRATAPLSVGPTLLGGTLYQNLPEKALAAIDASTGKEMWRYPQPLQALILGDQKLLASAGNELLLLDNLGGKVIDRVKTARLKTVLRGPDNCLILVSPRGRMQRLDKLG